MLTQLDEAVHKASCVSLAVDESTDMCDNAQLLVYVRFFNTDQKAFCEDLLGVTPFKWVNAGPLQMQLVDLQADVALKEQFVRSDSSTFWLQMVPETAFPGLRKVALHILTMFGSTYNCEAAFSTMNIIKTKYRSRLTNEHLHVYENCPDSIQTQV